MNDEFNKIPEGVQEEENAESSVQAVVPETENEAVQESDALNEELEALRETFQEKYDETVEEAENGPVIQELEEGEPEDEDESEDEAEEKPETSEKKPKKKRKWGKIIAITIPVLVLVAIVGSLVAYVVASVTNPNFSSFISTYAEASAAQDYEDRITYLEKAITYCSDTDSAFQQAMKATILEEIVVEINANEGYSAAYSYMKSKMSDEAIKNPVSAAFRKFVSSVNAVNELALDVFNKVYENIGDAETLPEYEALVKGLDVPEQLAETMNSVVTAFGDGILYDKKASGIDDSVVAMNYYATGYSGLVSMGADERELAEKLTVDLYNKGFVIEAAALSSVAVDPEEENVNSDYTKVMEKISEIGKVEINILAVANKAVEDENTSAEDILAAVKAVEGVTDENADIFASVVSYAVQAITSENEKNLTAASSEYATLTSVLEAFSMTDASLHLKTAEVIFNSGNLSDASTLITTYLSEEAVASLTDEEKASYDKMTAVFAALSATSEVFSPYYSDYYQTGTPMDYDEVKAAFDEKFGEDATNYEKGFVYYCLYMAAVSADDSSKINEAISGVGKYLSDLPLVYLYYYTDNCLAEDNIGEAKKYAEKILEVNIADGFATSVVAMSKRVGGDIDGAVETALKGIELAGGSAECSFQLAVAYLLKGDLETAYGYVRSVFNENQSLDSYDLILIFDALYEGENEDIKTELATFVSTVNQTYTYYGLSAQEDTQAILDGTKTLEDVFLKGNYKLS